jgi:DNA-binding beta-propeller fold protein YncE
LITGQPEQALSHSFDFMSGMAIDGRGRLYVAEARLHRVFRVDKDGGIVNVAGVGLPVSAGDGGPAADASFELPTSLAVDALGRLHIAEEAFIRRVELDGTITTVVGNGIQGTEGDGELATNAAVWNPTSMSFDAEGRLYFTDSPFSFSPRIRRVEFDGSVVSLRGTELSSAVVVDRAGRIYFSDGGNNRLGRMDTDGTITTVGPFAMGLAIDHEDRVLLAEVDTHRVLRLEHDDTLTTIAGMGIRGFSGDGGPAIDAMLDGPDGVAVDDEGRVVISDRGNLRVRRIDANGVISTIAGGVRLSGQAIGFALRPPATLAVDGRGGFFIAEFALLRHVDSDGFLTTVAGTGKVGSFGDGRVATQAELVLKDVATDAEGRLYVADDVHHRVRRIDTDGIITTIAGTGKPGFGGDGGPALSASFSPHAIAVDDRGRPHIVDRNDHRVRRLNSDGTMVTVAGTGVAGFLGDGRPATEARLNRPQSIATDREGGFYVVDNERVRYVNRAGIIRTVAGNGNSQFAGEGGAAVDASISPDDVAVGSDGLVYVADAGNGRVYRLEADGTITTIAGGSPASSNGEDGALAMETAMVASSIALDGRRVLVTTETGLVRAFTPGGSVTTVAGRVPPEGPPAFPTARLLPTGTIVAVDDHRLVSVGGLRPYTAMLLDLEEEVVSTIVGPADSATISGYFNLAYGAAFDPVVGSVLITDSATGELHVLRDVAGPASTWTLRSTSTSLTTPTGIAYDPTRDDFVVAEEGQHCVRRTDRGGSVLGTVVGRCGVSGRTAALLDTPTQVLVSPRSGAIYVADTGNHRVLRVGRDGAEPTVVLDDGDDATTAPHQMAMDDTGNLFVASTNVVRLVENIDGDTDADADDRVVTIYGEARDTYPASDAYCLKGLARMNDGRVVVSDGCHGFVVELTPIP